MKRLPFYFLLILSLMLGLNAPAQDLVFPVSPWAVGLVGQTNQAKAFTYQGIPAYIQGALSNATQSAWMAYHGLSTTNYAAVGGSNVVMVADGTGLPRPSTVSTQMLESLAPMAMGRLPRGGLRLSGGANPITGTVGLNLGTNDFSVSATIQFADYTPSSNHILLRSHSGGNNRIGIRLTTAGQFDVQVFDNAGANVAYGVTPSPALVDGNLYHLTVTVSRAGNATFYINGATQGAVSITAASGVDIGAANALLYNAGDAVVGAVGSLRVDNRALAAAEVTKLMEEGKVSYQDQGGSTTALTFLNNGFETDAAAVSPPSTWTASGNHVATVAADASVEGTKAVEIVASAAGTIGTGTDNLQKAIPTHVIGKRYRIVISGKSISGNTTMSIQAGGNPSTSFTLTASYLPYSFEYTASVVSGNLRIALGGAGTFRVDAINFYSIGSILDLDINFANPAVDRRISDRSGNAYHATSVSSGVDQLLGLTRLPAWSMVVTNQYYFSSNGVFIAGFAAGGSTDGTNGIGSGGWTTTNLVVGGATAIKGFPYATANLTFTSVPGGGGYRGTQTITVTGASVNDPVVLGLPSSPDANFEFSAYVSAPNTVTVGAKNTTASTLTAAAATYSVMVIRH